MTDLTTTTTKGRDGWQAKTLIMLPGIPNQTDTIDGERPAFLEISTHKKPFGKGLKTTAMVSWKTPHGFTHAFGMGSRGGDWSRDVKSNPAARCTEKTVATQHAESLLHLPLILTLVGEHYNVADPVAVLETA